MVNNNAQDKMYIRYQFKEEKTHNLKQFWL